MSTKTDEIYNEIMPLLSGERGRIIAIEEESGDYFLGDSVSEALNDAKKKHPKKLFHIKRVGSKGVYFIGSLSS